LGTQGVRPVVGARVQRKYLYAFSAVSPHDGVLDSLVLPWVNAETMSLFLDEVARRHADEFVFMVMDQAGWHIAGELGAAQHAVDVLAALQPRTQSGRAPVGGDPRGLLRQPRLRRSRRRRSRAHHRHRVSRSQPTPNPVNDRVQVDNFYIIERDLV
jgi:hypothetical protein